MGDMNADCGYVNNAEKANLVLKKDDKYHWWIDDDADSTVASTRSSNCAYDRYNASYLLIYCANGNRPNKSIGCE